MTKRQEIFQFLKQADFSARELSKAIGIREKEVYDHLKHIEKSAKSKKIKFKIVAAQCVSCGYTFKKRERLTRPGRCPICKKEQIDPPRFQIV